MDDRFSRVLARLDALDAEDPRGVDPLLGTTPAVAYGRRMLQALPAVCDAPSELLRLAARASHVGRFRLPRSAEPEGRVGYLTWRKRLAAMHAELASEAMASEGYDAEACARVAALVQKKALRTDAETQALEDAACIVFLTFEFAEFAARTDDDKMVDILRKTWGKMSPRGHAAALALPLDGRPLALVQRALAGDA